MGGGDTVEITIVNNSKVLSGRCLQNAPLQTMLSLTMSFLIVAKKRVNIKKGKLGMQPYATQVSSEN